MYLCYNQLPIVFTSSNSGEGEGQRGALAMACEPR